MAESLKYYRHYIITNPTTDTTILKDGELGVYESGTDIRLRLGDGTTQVKDLADFVLPRTADIENAATGAYTLTPADNGDLVVIDSGLTIPTGLNVGFNCTVFLDSLSSATLTTTGLTVKGNISGNIAPGGVITIAIIATDTALIVGGLQDTPTVANILSTDNLLHVRDEKASGTVGKTVTANTWTQADLQTVKTNNLGATLNSNQITGLAAGDYWAEIELSISSEINGAAIGLARLQTSDPATLLVSSGSGGAQINSFESNSVKASQIITIAAGKTIQLYGYIKTINGTPVLFSFGRAVTSGEVEVYADVKLWKL